MSTVAKDFKYLWSAVFEDGTVINQPEDDLYSKADPKSENNPSAFRDVLDKQKEAKLVFFYLARQDLVPEVNIGVDLVTGQFEANGIRFDAHEQNLDLSTKELQIVFHREVRKDTIMGSNWEEQGVNHYINRYFIGWQIVGENTVQTIAVG